MKEKTRFQRNKGRFLNVPVWKWVNRLRNKNCWKNFDLVLTQYTMALRKRIAEGCQGDRVHCRPRTEDVTYLGKDRAEAVVRRVRVRSHSLLTERRVQGWHTRPSHTYCGYMAVLPLRKFSLSDFSAIKVGSMFLTLVRKKETDEIFQVWSHEKTIRLQRQSTYI